MFAGDQENPCGTYFTVPFLFRIFKTKWTQADSEGTNRQALFFPLLFLGLFFQYPPLEVNLGSFVTFFTVTMFNFYGREHEINFGK